MAAYTIQNLLRRRGLFDRLQDCRPAASALAGSKGVEMFSFYTLTINAFRTVFGVTEILSIGVTHIQRI